eukprot:69191-Chlamydomonas_euryale.AAC.1
MPAFDPGNATGAHSKRGSYSEPPTPECHDVPGPSAGKPAGSWSRGSTSGESSVPSVSLKTPWCGHDHL